MGKHTLITEHYIPELCINKLNCNKDENEIKSKRPESDNNENIIKVKNENEPKLVVDNTRENEEQKQVMHPLSKIFQSSVKKSTDIRGHYGHASIAMETDLRLSVEREAQNSILDSNENPITFTNRIVLYPNPFERNRNVELSINQRISELEKKENNETQGNTVNIGSVENSVDTQNTPHLISLKRAWEENPIKSTDKDEMSIRNPLTNSSSFLAKSRTIITRRVKKGKRFIKLSRNPDILDTDRQIINRSENDVVQLPLTKVEESKLQSRNNNDLEQVSTRLNKYIKEAICIEDQENSLNRVEPYASSNQSDSSRARNKRMSSNAGLLENS